MPAAFEFIGLNKRSASLVAQYNRRFVIHTYGLRSHAVSSLLTKYQQHY